jgi:transcriptional regulator with XRE-family HTH domain
MEVHMQHGTVVSGSSTPFGVAVNANALRRQMQLRGLTGTALARRARVSEATISHALNGRRIHPAKLRAIADALSQVQPLPGADALVESDSPADGRDREEAEQ